jgi:hypothetical protein
MKLGWRLLPEHWFWGTPLPRNSLLSREIDSRKIEAAAEVLQDNFLPKQSMGFCIRVARKALEAAAGQ